MIRPMPPDTSQLSVPACSQTGRCADSMIETEYEEIVERFLGTESAGQVKGVEGPDRLPGAETILQLAKPNAIHRTNVAS